MNLPTKLRRGGNGPGPILFTWSCESTPDVSRPIGNRPQFDNRLTTCPTRLELESPTTIAKVSLLLTEGFQKVAARPWQGYLRHHSGLPRHCNHSSDPV